MERVWISDPHEGFVLGRIVDLTEDGALVSRLGKSMKEESVSFDRLYTAEADDQVCILSYAKTVLGQYNFRLANAL